VKNENGVECEYGEIEPMDVKCSKCGQVLPNHTGYKDGVRCQHEGKYKGNLCIILIGNKCCPTGKVGT